MTTTVEQSNDDTKGDLNDVEMLESLDNKKNQKIDPVNRRK